jgi:hypothetical protein
MGISLTCGLGVAGCAVESSGLIGPTEAVGTVGAVRPVARK